jgi:hypothetical protein
MMNKKICAIWESSDKAADIFEDMTAFDTTIDMFDLTKASNQPPHRNY